MPFRSPACIALAISFCLTAAAAASSPTITYVEGKSTIISGARGFLPVPGVTLRQCDIVSTAPQALVQAEFADGGQIIVGHDTRLLFELPGSDGEAASPVVLLAGWAKVVVAKRDKAPPHRIATQFLDISIDAGAAVVHVDAEGAAVFVERGDAIITVGGAAGSRTTVNAWQTFSLKPGQRQGSVVKGIEPGFLKGMPRPLRDSMPSMLARLKARDVQPQPAPAYDAKEAEQWFKTIAQLRPCVADNTVRSGQEALARHGLEVGAIDGILGPRTQAALRAFQQQRSLTVSGQFDPGTLKALDVGGRR